ncbi:putative quinate permease [Escovopsis weberi]|uniref:Putative quinate permease n=1 Tax=Escovopsis weberi TaxID=150374 RepID=A0A0M8MXK4_ESCWE|nr:putative quinate permease [Escovopsis weberi]
MGAMARVLRTIVRNDAMRTDPDEIYGWRVFALVFSACFGGMLFGWDTGAIGGILSLPEFQERFNYADKSPTAKSNLSQNIVSTLQAGCFAACFFTSWATDRWGRRACLIGTGLLTCVGIVFQTASAAQGTLAVMYVGRFISGLGIGAASTLTPLYVSECAPRAIRGGLTAFYQLFNVFGIMTAFWINYGCLLHVPKPALYLVPLALQALPAILPADSEYVRNEIHEMSSQLEYERRLTGDAGFKTLLKEMFTVPGNRNRAVISVLLMIFQQMTGVNAINYYAPEIFKNLGMSGTDSSLFATGVAQGLFLYIVGIYGRVQPPIEGQPVSAFGYVAITCIYLWASSFQFGWGPVCWILASEIPTARLRAMNVAIASATQWLFNFICARTVLTMQLTMGKAGFGMFFMFGTFCFIMVAFVWFFVPETKGLSLEKMDELFGMSERGKDEEQQEHELDYQVGQVRTVCEVGSDKS